MISEATREKLRVSHLGHRHTDEQKRKIGLAALGNKYAVGLTPWNKGIKTGYNKKQAIKVKGKPAWNKGKKMSYPNMGRKKGGIAWNKGKKYLQISGEKHPMWKGGISKHYKSGYYSFEYKKWRKTVFERDGYTCQVCKNIGGYLTAHHIKSFAKYPELRLKLNNGITLCEDCHSMTDNYKGRAKRR